MLCHSLPGSVCASGWTSGLAEKQHFSHFDSDYYLYFYYLQFGHAQHHEHELHDEKHEEEETL